MMERLKRMLSLQAYGLVTSLLFRAHTPPRRMRARFARLAQDRASLQRKHPGMMFEDHALGSLRMEALRTTQAPRRALVHLHGGAFVFGSPECYRNRAMRLSHRCDAEVFVPGYRLAPEQPYPAALEDAVAAIQYVRALRPELPLFISGDSAGGGLALSALVRLRELGQALPQGALLLSPWTDLSVSGASVDAKAGADRWFTRAHLEQWATYYRGTTHPETPLLSPVFADLRGLPALLVLVGEDELLYDDAARVVASATRAGTMAELWVGAGMQHDWPLTLPWLAESRRAWKRIVQFVNERSAVWERSRGLQSERSQRGARPAEIDA